jgi:hypothetical protein
LEISRTPLGGTSIRGELPMTAPQARQSQILPRPACTPAAIRAVLAANGCHDVLQHYDDDLYAAFEQAREQGDLTPLAARRGIAVAACQARAGHRLRR